MRKLKRARTQLAAERDQSVGGIAGSVCVGTSTVYRTTRRAGEEGLEAALSELFQEGVARKLSALE